MVVTLKKKIFSLSFSTKSGEVVLIVSIIKLNNLKRIFLFHRGKSLNINVDLLMSLVKKFEIVGTSNPGLLRKKWSDLHLKYNQDTTGESFTKVQLQNKFNNYKKDLSKAKSKRTQSFKKTGRIHM